MESSSGRIPAIGFDVYVYVSVQHHSPVEGQVCDDDDDDDCDSPWTSLFDIYRMGFGWIQSLDDGAAQGDSFGHRYRYLYLYLYLFDVSFVGISISIACLCFVLVVWIFVVVSVTVLLVDDRHQYFL